MEQQRLLEERLCRSSLQNSPDAALGCRLQLPVSVQRTSSAGGVPLLYGSHRSLCHPGTAAAEGSMPRSCSSCSSDTSEALAGQELELWEQAC